LKFVFYNIDLPIEGCSGILHPGVFGEKAQNPSNAEVDFFVALKE
jgi:hypothetical protein